ncbi:MAG: biotin/lipoate A/B protein ligase family protein [Cyanobacteria bacterium J06560_2]
MPDSWRFMPLYEGTGVEQMAIDSWLLDQHVQGLQPSILRFYVWRSPTISLGYHQKQFPAHWNNLHYKGQRVDLVRRPTGGRAVLHQGDLTYALVTSGLKGSRREVYQQLCQFLLEGWRSLGVELNFGVAGRGYIKNPNCFGTATAADLVMNNGYKLIGSAQVLRAGCVLQHGSIRLSPESQLFEAVFGEKMGQPAFPPSLLSGGLFEQITRSLMASASAIFDVEFETRSLTPAEIQKAMTTRLPGIDLPVS